MKVNLMNGLFLALAIIIQSCGSNNSSQEYEPAAVPAAVIAPVKVKFDGSFAGNANNTKFRLDIENINGRVSGTMKDGNNSYVLNGSINDEKLTGILKYVLGDIPFEAYYNGPSIVLQLDPDTMNGLKLLAAVASDDGNVFLADDKIIFDER